MIARVVAFQGKPEKLEEGIRAFREITLPAVKKIKGFKEGYFMVNRQTGRVIGMTMWETEKDLNESNAIAGPIISQISQKIAATQPMIETYEVAVAGK